MEENISKIKYFLFKKRHDILGGNILFVFQSEFARFATEVPGNNFFGKEPGGIRPFISQQLQVEEKKGKSIKNHHESYQKIVLARVNNLRPDISEDEKNDFLSEFSTFFTKEQYISQDPLKKANLFDSIDFKILSELSTVAKAHGGELTYEQFSKYLKNLTQDST